MKLRVLLDMDGVIANFYHGFASYLNSKHGCSLDPNTDPSTYSFDKWDCGVENVDFDTASRNWISQGGFADLPAFDGAEEFVKELTNICKVYIVTARIGEWDQKFTAKLKNQIKNDTENWLKKHGMPVDRLFFTHEKIQFCNENGISLLIEDKMSTALEASKNGLHTVLMNRGYNGSQIDRYKIYRVYDFNEALNQVKRIMDK